MKTLALLMLLAATGPSFAQTVTGPIVQRLDGNYFLVQCNGAQPQADDPVSVRRDGREVARGNVMRIQNGQCSVRLDQGIAEKADIVYLLPTRNTAGDRGPSLPTAYTARPTPANASKPLPPRSKREEYFSTLQTGRVLNLSSGEMTP